MNYFNNVNSLGRLLSGFFWKCICLLPLMMPSSIQAQSCNSPGDIVLYEEAIDGEISGNAGSPDVNIVFPGAFDPAISYVVNGSAPDTDRDAITFTVPFGAELSFLNINTHTPCAAIDRVLIWDGPDNTGTQLYSSLNAGYVSGNLGPLPAGTYTLLINQNADVGPDPICSITCYRIAFRLSCAVIPVTCPADFSVCTADGIVFLDELIDISPSSVGPESVFSGPGVTAFDASQGLWDFDPEVAGVGVHTIIYSYFTEAGCGDSCQFNITVFESPEVDCPGIQAYCVNEDPADLNLLVTPAGGVFSGAPIVDGIFDPGVAGTGIYLINYSVTSAEGCTDDCSFIIGVTPIPNSNFRNPGTPVFTPYVGQVEFNADHDICELDTANYGSAALPVVNSYSWSISGGGTIIAGANSRHVQVHWTEPGVHTLSLTVTQISTECQSTNEIVVTVLELPEVTCPSDIYVCESEVSIDFDGLATPAGGTYSGNFITGTEFSVESAGLGTHQVEYSFIGANGCENTCTFNVLVRYEPTMEFESTNPDSTTLEICNASFTDITPVLDSISQGFGLIQGQDYQFEIKAISWSETGDEDIDFTGNDGYGPVTGADLEAGDTITVISDSLSHTSEFSVWIRYEVYVRQLRCGLLTDSASFVVEVRPSLILDVAYVTPVNSDSTVCNGDSIDLVLGLIESQDTIYSIGTDYVIVVDSIEHSIGNDSSFTLTYGPLTGGDLEEGDTISVINEALSHTETVPVYVKYNITLYDSICISGSSHSIILEIAPKPYVVCPADTTISAIPNIEDECTGTYFFVHPTVTAACEPVDLFFSIDGGTPVSVIQGDTITIELGPEADYTVNYSVTDGFGNSDSCSFIITVLDNIAPVVECKDTLIILTSTDPYILLESDVLNLANTFDACSDISISIFPAELTCENVKDSVAILVTVEDENGNTATCTTNILVGEDTTLPSPWSNDDVGASNGSAEFSGCTGDGTFSVSSSGFSFPTADIVHSLYQNICGNGSITVRVVSVTNLGWGGIQFRESLMPGSRKIAFQSQLSNTLVRQVRAVTNGVVTSQSINRVGHTWLRIERIGNSFTGYSSPNGTNWFFAFNTILVLPACLQVGMYAQSINMTTEVTASFDNVTVIGTPLPPVSDHTGSDLALDQSHLKMIAMPNPASQMTQIIINGIHGNNNGTLTISDIMGRTVFNEKVNNGSVQVPVDNWMPGLYSIRLEHNGNTCTDKLLIVK
jgi:hypothetical protein